MKDKLGAKIMKEFVALEPKTDSYLIDDGSEDKKVKGKKKKKCALKKKLTLENCKNCLKAIQLENKTNHLEQNEIDVGKYHNDTIKIS